MKITTAESSVMEALWRRSPLGADEITAEVARPQRWSEATVKTLINRLLKKKAIGAKPDGRRYLYRPLVAREDYLQSESQGLLNRLFGGELAPLVAHFAKSRNLKPEEVARLKRLIDELPDDE